MRPSGPTYDPVRGLYEAIATEGPFPDPLVSSELGAADGVPPDGGGGDAGTSDAGVSMGANGPIGGGLTTGLPCGGGGLAGSAGAAPAMAGSR